MAMIYGVDTDGPVSAEDVRDAIVTCFEQAQAGTVKESLKDTSACIEPKVMDRIAQMSVKECVHQAFAKTGGSFEAPDKESIIRALDYLREFSESFRSPEVIERHYNEIMQLVERLK